MTLPPTDALDGDVPVPASDAWRFALLVLAGILATLLALTPVKRRV